VDRPADDVRRQRQQAPGLVVHQRDPVCGVQADHTLADAVQHGLAVFDETGDLTWFEAERLPLHPARQQERADDADDQRDAEDRQRLGGGADDALQERRGRHTRGHHTDHRTPVAHHRHVRDERVVDDPDPRAPLPDHRVTHRQRRAELVGVLRGQDGEVRAGDGHVPGAGQVPRAGRERRQLVVAQRVGESLPDGQLRGDVLRDRQHAAALDVGEGLVRLDRREHRDGREQRDDDQQLPAQQLPRQRAALSRDDLLVTTTTTTTAVRLKTTRR
jgi:hypothetical protein